MWGSVCGGLMCGVVGGGRGWCVGVGGGGRVVAVMMVVVVCMRRVYAWCVACGGVAWWLCVCVSGGGVVWCGARRDERANE